MQDHSPACGDHMTRIGFAYNEKPTVAAITAHDPAVAESARDDDEPPSSGARAAAATAIASACTAPADDEFAEWDAPETIDAVASALSAMGDVIRIEADDDFPHRLRDAQPDIVFNIAEGLRGANRESHIPAICEFYGIPYSASDPFTLALCLDKARTKQALSFHGVPTAAFEVISSRAELHAWLLRGSTNGRTMRVPLPTPSAPLFAKPLHEGSSKGITERNLCRNARDLETTIEFLLGRYEQPVIVETYLPGAEFTCAVLGNGHDAEVLPIVGMNFASLPDGALPIYGYEAKWIWDRPENPLAIFSCPAPITLTLQREIERVTLAAYGVLGCRDWSRIDVRLDAAGVPNVIEVNPLPGILPDPSDNSCFPKAARAAGLGYDALIQRCLAHAAERQGVLL